MDLASINLIRVGNGLEPLTELPGATTKEVVKNENGSGEDAGTETPEQIEAKRVAAEQEAAKKKKEEEGNSGELDDAQLLALLDKRGIKVASLEDLKKQDPAPDPALLAEQREANELAFGLSKGLFNKKEYDQFVADTQDPQDFVYDEYYADAKKEDPTLSDEDIQAEFLHKYGLDAQPDTRQFKRGVKEIASLAKSMLKDKYGKIYSAKEAFTSAEQETVSTTVKAKKIAAALPAYTKDVEEIFASLKKIPVKFSDTESYEVELLDTELNKLKIDMLNPDFYGPKIEAGYDKEVLKQIAFSGFVTKNFPVLAMEIANQHLLKHAAGTHGVPLLGGKTKEADAPVLTAAQQKLVDMHKESERKVS